MYKIYINEVQCILMGSKDFSALKPEELKDTLTCHYAGKVKYLLNYIDMCEKGSKIDKMIIYHENFKLLLADFTGLFKLQFAAGGLVSNSTQDFLLIFRRQFWDLPKGKIEKDETKKQAAIREVIEETGIEKVAIDYKIGVTHHAFKNKNGVRIIKTSYWYKMSTFDQLLVPQVEEEIEKAVWGKLEEIDNTYTPMYRNIQDVIHTYQAIELGMK